MVDQIAIVKVAISNTAVVPFTVDFTSPSITETFSAAILLFTRTNVDDSAQDGGFMGLGFIGVNGAQGENSLQATIGAGYENGVTSNAGGLTVRSPSTCIRIPNNAVSALRVVAAYSASIAGGVRISVSQVDDPIIVTAILFAGLSKAAAGGCTHSEAGSHEDVGAAADQFQPDLVIFVPSDNSLTLDSANATPSIGFGLNNLALSQISTHLNYDNNSDPTDADGFYRSDAASCAFIGDRIASQDRFVISSFDSTGWNATAIDTGDPNTPQAHYLALKFSSPFRMACAHLPVAASTGTQSFNQFGFTPDLVFGLANFLTTSNSITDGGAGAAGAYFATGRYGSRSISAAMQENLDLSAITPVASVSKTRQGDHAVTCLDHTGALALQAEWLGGTGSGGFALNFTTAAQAGTLTALGIQLVPNTPFRTRWPDRLATRRNRKPAKRAFGWMGKTPAQALPRFWRAIQRFRRAMAQRLMRRPLPPAEPVDTTPSATGQEAEGAIFSAGAKRAEVVGGGAVEGSVF